MKSSFRVHRSNLLYKNNLKGLYFKNHPAKVKYGVIMEISTEAVAQRCSVKKMFLKVSQNSQENTCARQRLFFNKVRPQACNFIKKESLAQVFSCGFYEISKNTFFFKEHLRWPLLYLFIRDK